MPYWEGQSYGVIPPGTNPKNGAAPQSLSVIPATLYPVSRVRCYDLTDRHRRD